MKIVNLRDVPYRKMLDSVVGIFCEYELSCTFLGVTPLQLKTHFDPVFQQCIKNDLSLCWVDGKDTPVAVITVLSSDQYSSVQYQEPFSENVKTFLSLLANLEKGYAPKKPNKSL